jgi:hypothetical protein
LARDYAAFVATIRASADAGDPQAQYLTARALRYCDEALKRYFRTTAGGARSLTEAQRHWANRPPSYQQLIANAYERCHVYAEDQSPEHATSAWGPWLAQAAAAGFAPAQSEQAELMRLASLDAAATGAAGPLPTQDTNHARDLALVAVLSADPDSILVMANWVDSTRRPAEEYAALVSAWQLLACQRGYEGCMAGSDWVLSVCTTDPQCSPEDAMTDALRRQLGNRFDEVQGLANAIGAAVDAGDPAAIESFL